VKNVTVDEYYRGLVMLFNEELIIENIQLALNDTFDDFNNIAINVDVSINALIDNVNIHNYIRGIQGNSANNISIKNVNTLSDQTLNSTNQQGIVMDGAKVLLIENTNIHNYFIG